MKQISFEDFKKIDLRIGEIKAVKIIEGADKLYILLVGLGKGEQDIQLVAGIREHYKENELIGGKIVVVRNLTPKVFKIGNEEIESQGMVLAGVFKNKIVLIQPEKDIETGAKVE